MFKKPQYLAILLTLVLAGVLLSLPARRKNQLKRWIGTVFVVGFGASKAADAAADKARVAVTPRKVLGKQLADLQEENQRLRLQLKQAGVIARENDRLRAALNWKKQTRWEVSLARVIGRDPSNWRQVILIDRGARDGVTENMPIVANEGLVGRVSSVGMTRSQVVLIGDPKCKVGAMIESTGEAGVVETGKSGALGRDIVALNYIAGDSELKPGDRVLTSGLGTVFPKGIPVGTVIHARTLDYGLTKDARVKLHVNLNRLEHVWVLTN